MKYLADKYLCKLLFGETTYLAGGEGGGEATVKYWGHWFTRFKPFSTRKTFLIVATTLIKIEKMKYEDIKIFSKQDFLRLFLYVNRSL